MSNSNPDGEHDGSTPLNEMLVGVSVANSENLDDYGYTPDEVNRVTARLSEALISSGARLAFGHDWRPDGIMEAINRIIVSCQEPANSAHPWVENFLPWPQNPAASEEVRIDMEERGLVRITQTGLPDGYQPNTDPSPDDMSVSLCWARQQMTGAASARVCLGGKTKSSMGFHAGIVEEAWRAAEAKQPVYVAAFLGGAAADLTAVLLGSNEEFASMSVIESRQDSHAELSSQFPNLIPPADLADRFKKPTGFQKRSGLNPDEWEMLLKASDIEVFAALVVRGLTERSK